MSVTFDKGYTADVYKITFGREKLNTDQSRFLRTQKIGNFGINVNIVFPYICSFSIYFVPYYVSKCKIRYLWVPEAYILSLQTPLVFFISNGTAKTELAILTFFYR